MKKRRLHPVQILLCLVTSCRASVQENRTIVPGAGRVTIFADDFESGFPGGWHRKGNVPANSALYDGTPRHGTHSLRLMGSPATDKGDVDCYMQREVSTAGYSDIQVSFYMGASGMDDEYERAIFCWADGGVASPHGHWFCGKEAKGTAVEIGGGDAKNDGQLHHFSFSLPAEAGNNPKLTLWFGNQGTNETDDNGYLDDVVVTGERPGAGRVTIFSDDFEGDFPGGWDRQGNVPTLASLYTGAPKRGAHSVQLGGSPASGGDDFDTFLDRVVSTAGRKNIQVSFDMGTSGFRTGGEGVIAQWAERGAGSSNQYWHTFKDLTGSDREQDGALHHYTFSLPQEASNNPQLALFFGVYGLGATTQAAYVDDVVVTGE